jgi:hypothetical protein
MWRNHQSIPSSKQYQKRQQDVQKDRQRGRSERGGESYSLPYVEPLSDARTKLAAFFNILPAASTVPHELRHGH